MDSYLETLVKENALRKVYLGGSTIETIYFGGGTPSLLSEKQVEHVVNEIQKNFILSQNAEITLEANPDDLTKLKLKNYWLAGVNRISIGVQSFS